MATYIVAITGASGSIYAEKLLKALKNANHEVSLLLTDPGRLVVEGELDWNVPDARKEAEDYIRRKLGYLKGNSELKYYDYHNIGAQIASGSAQAKAMIIIPCSMSTLSGIACGSSKNLVERAADVMLKERRPLIVVPRETPLNQIHLKNMLALTEAGAYMVPAMPAFYQKPQTIDHLADFIAGRVLDLLNVEHNLFNRWQGNLD